MAMHTKTDIIHSRVLQNFKKVKQIELHQQLDYHVVHLDGLPCFPNK